MMQYKGAEIRRRGWLRTLPTDLLNKELYHRRRRRRQMKRHFEKVFAFSKRCRVYSNQLKMSNVGGECPQSRFLGTTLKLRKRKKNSSLLVYVLNKV